MASSACGDCKPADYQTERITTWNIAVTLLDRDWGGEYGKAIPLDVLNLARYLDGMD